MISSNRPRGLCKCRCRGTNPCCTCDCLSFVIHDLELRNGLTNALIDGAFADALGSEMDQTGACYWENYTWIRLIGFILTYMLESVTLSYDTITETWTLAVVIDGETSTVTTLTSSSCSPLSLSFDVRVPNGGNYFQFTLTFECCPHSTTCLVEGVEVPQCLCFSFSGAEVNSCTECMNGIEYCANFHETSSGFGWPMNSSLTHPLTLAPTGNPPPIPGCTATPDADFRFLFQCCDPGACDFLIGVGAFRCAPPNTDLDYSFNFCSETKVISCGLITADPFHYQIVYTILDGSPPTIPAGGFTVDITECPAPLFTPSPLMAKAPTRRVASLPTIYCEHLGPRTEFKAGCGGANCLHKCTVYGENEDVKKWLDENGPETGQSDETIPNGSCKGCPGFTPRKPRTFPSSLD